MVTPTHITDTTKISVDGNPTTWRQFVHDNTEPDVLCSLADIATIRADLEQLGRCNFDGTEITIQ
jgi:hypothetical protein